ncbi:aromatic ring-hydroxylating oxygenase subunit alpha [Roseovarius atlanticus]|uniref:aromatic ring-hydroxylating oxygenase subunit alpha n=1 Tax=Roseovarius atlanticus TaxID=1641875 RepID=UPI001C97CF59|nr:Rieske 2Fe-2S domain-containing protein [Roseovarius atlanticus]MBY5986316.1 Rieske 2Fe-2S domain-containing protein [Roseovarius atlanticus]MBY6124956.1 Rieske 2Fe-2S domain-containing protein [Roseovarius atlanticus]MBY6150583.1 Rieske 2Fe-2S domain-containing protein [Roseovarius atlanticus]
MTLAKPIANPIDALRANVSAPFEQARAMPPEVYKTDAFLQAEIEHIFRKEWFCVGRADALAKPGDYVTCELADQPVIVLRDREGDLKAFSNVCRHRMSTLLHGRGHTKSIVCPYHAWTYNLDGSLRGAPAMSGNSGFCKSDYALPEIRCEEWLGWVFITLNPEAEPVASRLSELERMIAGYDMTNYTETFFEEHVWDTNWKVLAENFMESYHLPVCHAGTIGGLSKLEEMVCPPGHDAFNYHTILKDDSLRIAMAHPSNTRLEGDERRMTYLIAVYPSLMITLTPGYFWYLGLHPKGPSQVRIRFGGGMSDDYAGDAEAEQNLADLKALLDDVNIEDRGCTEKVYRGLCADGAEPGHLSHLERPNFDFAQYLMNRIDPSFTPKL